MTIHVMLDIESLSTASNAAITQISAVPFDKDEVYAHLAFNRYVSIDDQVNKYGAGVSQDTLGWWFKQGNEAQSRLAEGLAGASDFWTVNSAMKQWPWMFGNRMSSECRKWEDFGGIWAHGTHFDISIINAMCEKVGVAPPWGVGKTYRLLRDTRTLFSLVTDSSLEQVEKDNAHLVAHDALDDCVMQAKKVQSAMKTIGAW